MTADMEEFAALVAGDMNGLDARADSLEHALDQIDPSIQDTGWRDISADVNGRISGRLLIRRRGERLMIALEDLAIDNSGTVALPRLPSGFRPTQRAQQFWFYPQTPTIHPTGTLHVSPSPGGYFNLYNVENGTQMGAQVEVDITTSWPSSLPGTPA